MIHVPSIRVLCCLSCTLFVQAVVAQTVFIHTDDPWHEDHLNELTNVRYSGNNPIRIAYNQRFTTGTARVAYGEHNGLFKAVDAAKRQRQLDVYVGGLKDLNQVKLSGHLQYQNRQETDRRWNSSFYLMPDNPFVLGDSVWSEPSSEVFRMSAELAWQCSKRWLLGAGVGLMMGSSSDQDDPRPKTLSSSFPVLLGAECQLNAAWHLGVSVRMEMVRTNINYTVVNPLNNHRFFLMKGLGEYFRRSTAGNPGYQRKYDGQTAQVGTQLIYTPTASRWSGFTEIAFSHGYENAVDGGEAYVFKGGDYQFSSLKGQARLILHSGRSTTHQLLVHARWHQGDGYWYDQKAVTDIEHGNRTDYKVLGKARVHQDYRLSTDLGYRLDMPFFVEGKIGTTQTWIKHASDLGTQKQAWMLAFMQATVGTSVQWRHYTLNTSVHGGCYLPLSERQFASASEETGNITDRYVAPQFEYLSAKRVRMGGMLDVQRTLKRMNVGLNITVDAWLHADDAAFARALRHTSRVGISTGLYMQF